MNRLPSHVVTGLLSGAGTAFAVWGWTVSDRGDIAVGGLLAAIGIVCWIVAAILARIATRKGREE